MGSLLARLRKTKTTVEILEEIEAEIGRLLKFKRQDQQLEKHYLGSLIIYSIVFYIAGALLFYFSFWPQTYTDTLIRVIPLLVFPIVIWGIRKVLQWYFIKRKLKNDIALDDLRERKKKILEDVKETENYKKAKEILERFDPSSRPPPTQLTPAVVVPANPRQPVPAVRRRTKTPPQTGRPVAMVPPGMPQRVIPALQASNTPQQHFPTRRPVTPRPILPQQRGTVDRLMDFLVGDGPENRYALICRQCHSHNGMALKEEFEYLSFRCAYCNLLNEARKQRKNAPKLPEFSLLNTPGTSPAFKEYVERGPDSQTEDFESRSVEEISINEQVTEEGEALHKTDTETSIERNAQIDEIKTETNLIATANTESALNIKDEYSEEAK